MATRKNTQSAATAFTPEQLELVQQMMAQAVASAAPKGSTKVAPKLVKLPANLTGDALFAALEAHAPAILSKTGRSLMIKDINVGTVAKPVYLTLTAPISK